MTEECEQEQHDSCTDPGSGCTCTCHPADWGFCTHPSPEAGFGSADVHERADGSLWAHLPCSGCGEYRVWQLEEV